MTQDELRAAAAEVVAVVGGYIASGDELAHEVKAKAVAEAYLRLTDPLTTPEAE